MAGIKVHGSVFSTATQRVFASLYEKELEYELVPVDMKAGEHKKEAFLSLNVSCINTDTTNSDPPINWIWELNQFILISFVT